ncbi:acyl carrier protein [Streptomyces sp. AJS327]|uniref:acyl carrier protein n=1 Tax=Streptomyces sp. AJS327 TaxID=2545265 RepID=UPI0015DDD379|nr:acyl carrier protein [Streptomyces sp. AJS327]MBA0052902.1 acyl carrier protein [Streptomyces sp. AJS327]
MDRAELIQELHKIAGEMAKPGQDSSPVEGAGEGGDTSLIDRYGFSSLDALEYLLILEEKFEVVFEDEDLTEETLFSIDGLATYILQQKVSGSPSS